MVATASPANRLRQALAALTCSASPRHARVTVSALCQLARVSRNSLYRYHPDVLGSLREHQRMRARVIAPHSRNTVSPQQIELDTLREQVPKLASLVDHFYVAYRETQALLSRRERELAEMRRRLDSKPTRLAR
jgi:hypothetical protein